MNDEELQKCKKEGIGNERHFIGGAPLGILK